MTLLAPGGLLCARTQNHRELVAILDKIFVTKSRAEWLKTHPFISLPTVYGVLCRWALTSGIRSCAGGSSSIPSTGTKDLNATRGGAGPAPGVRPYGVRAPRRFAHSPRRNGFRRDSGTGRYKSQYRLERLG